MSNFLLMSEPLWMLAVIQGYNGTVSWICHLAKLWISIALSSPYFHKKTDSVIGFVNVGWAKINIKWPHGCRMCKTFECIYGLAFLQTLIWSLGCFRMNGTGSVSLFNLLFENIISSTEALLGIVFRWTELSQQTVVITKPFLIHTAAHHQDINTNNLL